MLWRAPAKLPSFIKSAGTAVTSILSAEKVDLVWAQLLHAELFQEGSHTDHYDVAEQEAKPG